MQALLPSVQKLNGIFKLFTCMHTVNIAKVVVIRCIYVAQNMRIGLKLKKQEELWTQEWKVKLIKKV